MRDEMPGSMKAFGAVLALPLLAAMAPPGEAEDCRAWAEGGVHIDPILLSGIADRRVHVEIDAIVAEEVVQIAERGWMLGAALSLPGEGLTYPAGTILAPAYAARQPLCLPLAPPPGAESGAESGRWRAYGRGRLACLIDSNGDGAFEQVQMLGTDYAMHVPQARPYRMIALSAPARLVENPLGRPGTRRHVLRRIEIGAVSGDTALLRVLHAFRDPDRSQSEGAWESETDGTKIYRLAPPIPVPIDRSDSGWRSQSNEERTIALAQDSEVEVGGLRLRIERPSPSRPPGWNIVPLARHFPRWIHYGCGGRSIRVGVQPERPRPGD
jgi:hypothetical protein